MGMNEKLVRVGTIYLPVRNPKESAKWYSQKLGASIQYQDEDKVIIQLANQSFFLVKSPKSECANFQDNKGQTRFCLTFEVDGIEILQALLKEFKKSDISTGEIEDRGHAGKNFVFSDPDGNLFDVWSELSPEFKRMQDLQLR
jgi:catechol-2,3-dioxygenase